MKSLTIIVVGYNRPRALKSLFDSMQKLYVAPNVVVPLIISIDNKGTTEVNRLAHEFSWPFGTKEVIIHQEKKGLVNHFLWVGEQSLKYECVLFLEDDLIVSPDMINYAIQAIDFYENDNRIAGVTLYNALFSLHGMPFFKIQDGYDNYFFQHPYWGNIWFKNKWVEFKKYLETYHERKEILPFGVDNWNYSFKKIFIQYLIETGKTMVAPRISLVSNTAIAGLHTVKDTPQYQVSIMAEINVKYRFSSFDQSMSKYDAFEELDANILNKMNPLLHGYDFELDTKCLKKNLSKPYVITSMPKVKNALFTFSSQLKPIELAVGFGIEGEGISLVKNSKQVIPALKFLLELKTQNLINNNLYHRKVIFSTYWKMLKIALFYRIKKTVIHITLLKFHLKR